jgi:hypothetical protein
VIRRGAFFCADELAPRSFYLESRQILYRFRNAHVNPAAWTPLDVMHDEATYVCDCCGEEIVVPVDLSAGREQTYVEDCPVCCHPQVIHVRLDEDGELWLTGDAE